MCSKTWLTRVGGIPGVVFCNVHDDVGVGVCVYEPYQTLQAKPSRLPVQGRPTGQQTIPPDERRQDNRPETTAYYRLLNTIAV